MCASIYDLISRSLARMLCYVFTTNTLHSVYYDVVVKHGAVFNRHEAMPFRSAPNARAEPNGHPRFGRECLCVKSFLFEFLIVIEPKRSASRRRERRMPHTCIHTHKHAYSSEAAPSSTDVEPRTSLCLVRVCVCERLRFSQQRRRGARASVSALSASNMYLVEIVVKYTHTRANSRHVWWVYKQGTHTHTNARTIV